MKKLLTLSTALLFSAGAVMAQSNDAIVNQDGGDNEATIEQAGEDNSAELNQGFNGQGQNGAVGEIYQEGTENSASMNQRAWADRGNEHYIEQFGVDNVADMDIYNGNNMGFLLQDGENNSARMVQSGTNHESGIIQIGSDNYAQSRATGGSGNQTVIVQGSPYAPLDIGNETVPMGLQVIPIMPETGNNAATLKADGSENIAAITQFGSDNNAGENPQWSGDLGILIEGDSNEAVIGQFGSDNSANIAVFGDMNSAMIGQDGVDHHATVMQDGSGNSAEINQSGGAIFNGPIVL